MAKSEALTVRKAAPLAVLKRKRHPNRALTEAEIRLLLSSVEGIRDDALIRLGLSVGLRVSEIVTIRTSEIDFDHGLIKIWDEKKDLWRHVLPTMEARGVLKRYLNSLERRGQYLFPLTTKTCEPYRGTGAEPAVVMINTGDSPAIILKYDTKLPEVVMRRFVESKPVIP